MLTISALLHPPLLHIRCEHVRVLVSPLLNSSNWTLLIFLPNTGIRAESLTATHSSDFCLCEGSFGFIIPLFLLCMITLCSLNNKHMKVRTEVITTISDVPIIQVKSSTESTEAGNNSFVSLPTP